MLQVYRCQCVYCVILSIGWSLDGVDLDGVELCSQAACRLQAAGYWLRREFYGFEPAVAGGSSKTSGDPVFAFHFCSPESGPHHANPNTRSTNIGRQDQVLQRAAAGSPGW